MYTYDLRFYTWIILFSCELVLSIWGQCLITKFLQRLSEMCCSAVSQLLMLGKSIISNANKVQEEDGDADLVNIDWPEDSVEKAKLIRSKAQSITGYMEAVSNSFITG